SSTIAVSRNYHSQLSGSNPRRHYLRVPAAFSAVPRAMDERTAATISYLEDRRSPYHRSHVTSLLRTSTSRASTLYGEGVADTNHSRFPAMEIVNLDYTMLLKFDRRLKQLLRLQAFSNRQSLSERRHCSLEVCLA